MISKGGVEVKGAAALSISSKPILATPVESKAASFHKVPHEDYTNHLVKQKALIASEIETTSPSLLIQTLATKLSTSPDGPLTSLGA